MKTRIIIVTILLTIAIAFAVAIYFFVYNKPHTDYQKALADLELNATDLYYAFIEDEKAASEAYIGKILQIEGTAGYYEELETMVIVGFVFQDGMFGPEGIRCIMLENQDLHASYIQPGSNVIIKGLCTGFSGHDVILEHCSLVN
jgi:hypothetical protein